MTVSSPSIPLIDFSPFLTDDPVGKVAVAQAIYRACHEVGFFYLTHHGMPQAAIAAAFEQSRQFFALPLAQKRAITWASEVSNRGYIGLERERLDETQPGDLKEAFNLGRELSPAQAAALGIDWVKNPWPVKFGDGERDDFRLTMTAFFDTCAAAAEQVFRAFALALAMPEDFIASRHRTQWYTLRLLHYPPPASAPQPGQLRAGAHSDYGTLTLLFQDEMGGLEVLTAAGDWIAAPAIPGAVLVNTGDLTERWSNGVFRSTKHRVGLPQGEPGPVLNHRYSIAFFCEPDPEAVITCLPTCQGPDNPPQYPPITAGDYLMSRLQATY